MSIIDWDLLEKKLHKYDLDYIYSTTTYNDDRLSREEIIVEYKQERNRSKYKKEFTTIKKEYVELEKEINKLIKQKNKLSSKLSNKFGYRTEEDDY